MVIARIARRVTVVAVLAVLLAGCAPEPQVSKIDSDAVADALTSELTPMFADYRFSISCPAGPRATTGAAFTCTIDGLPEDGQIGRIRAEIQNEEGDLYWNATSTWGGDDHWLSQQQGPLSDMAR